MPMGSSLLALSNSSLAKWPRCPSDRAPRIVGIDIVDTIAGVGLELDDWNGHRYTDLFTLLKVDGAWKIMNDVFHQHH
jgi:hypothetical protein